ncbi:ComEC/Rec2 family competence protein [Arthrobacter sp. JUb115]|uniref:ComEC/Rec2 family competence protein n=1 Tax=Arthrobacter sp. JUb115 TaxID=2485108 RepID=UPI00105E7EEB|nr:ComEC/Rec2 family competence protein [Arthrobacter sp. JUb115]TDU29438.1 competence protein ComEC [Arthrobacter sp. JUb115]
MNTDFRGLWLLGGAWTAAYFTLPVWLLWVLSALMAVLLFLLLRPRHDRAYAAPWFTGPIILLLGVVAVSSLAFTDPQCQLPGAGEQQRRAVVRFEDPATAQGQGAAAGRAEIQRYWANGQWVPCRVPVFLTIDFGVPATAGEFETILDLEAAAAGAFDWWAHAASEPQVSSWVEPTAADYLKERFTQGLRGLPDNAQALLPGMLYGDRSGQDEALSEAMRSSGLSHLTAVSGSNIALIGAIVLVLLRLFSVPRAPSAILMIGVVGLFAWFAGPDPSVLRASLMGSIAVISVLLGRGQGSLGILCLSGTALLAIDRSLGAEPAFALSMLATLGIIMLAPALTEILLHIFPAWFAQLTAICCAAQFTCLPVVIALNSDFSLYSLPANLVVAPLLPLITALGMACLLLCTPWPALESVLIWVPGLPAEAIGQVAHFVSGLPGAARPWPEGLPGIVLAVMLSLVLCTLLVLGRETERLRVRQVSLSVLGAILVFAVALVLPATLFYREDIAPHWSIAMCDVGQGDAFVINLGDSEGWLIDTGPPESGLLLCLERLGISTLSKVFITHTHSDHFGAVGELENSHVKIGERLVSTGFDLELWPGARALEPGTRQAAGEVGFEVVGPEARFAKYAEPNDTSLVIRFSFSTGSGTIDLFTAGDMETEAMDRLLRLHPQGHAAILKASHHGARNGGTEIIEQIRPQILLVSAGKDNSYGHPHPETLAMAQQVGATVIRTDQSGTVLLTFTSQGVLGTSLGTPVR